MKKQVITLLAITYFLFPMQSCFAGNIFENLNAALNKISKNIPSSQSGNTVEVTTGKTKEITIGNERMNRLLILGVKNNDIDTVQTAISNGGNVNVYSYTNHAETPLTIALSNSNLTMINFLISQGADVDVKLWSSNNRPLMDAVKSSQSLDLVPLLVENGANVNNENTSGATAITYAISGYSANKARIIQYLIEQGANVNHVDTSGRTYLIQAIDFKYALEVVNVLLAAGADPNKIDSKGKKAVDYAISSNNKELINLLLPITR